MDASGLNNLSPTQIPALFRADGLFVIDFFRSAGKKPHLINADQNL